MYPIIFKCICPKVCMAVKVFFTFTRNYNFAKILIFSKSLKSKIFDTHTNFGAYAFKNYRIDKLCLHLSPAYFVKIWVRSDKWFLRYLTKGKIRSLCDLAWPMTLKMLKTSFFSPRPYGVSGSKVWSH